MVLKCNIHATEHGLDHRAIETKFNLEMAERPSVERLLLKNAPWGKIRERIKAELGHYPAQ